MNDFHFLRAEHTWTIVFQVVTLKPLRGPATIEQGKSKTYSLAVHQSCEGDWPLECYFVLQRKHGRQKHWEATDARSTSKEIGQASSPGVGRPATVPKRETYCCSASTKSEPEMSRIHVAWFRASRTTPQPLAHRLNQVWR
jgi:hypothetical protein